MVESVFSIIFEGLFGVFGYSIFIPFILIGLFVLFAFAKNLPIPSIFLILFLGVYYIGGYEINGISLLTVEFRILFMIGFGLILGILYFLFFYRK